MAEDTAAVLDAPASEAPEQPVEVQPDIQDAEVLPESTEEAPPETVTPPKRSIDELEENELLEHPRVKDVLARRQEAARRTQEAETTRRFTKQAEQVASVQNLRGTLAQSLAGAMKVIQDGNDLDPTYAEQLANYVTQNAWQYHSAIAVDWFNAALAAKMPADYKFSAKEMDTLRELHDDVATRRKDARELYEYRLNLYRDAVIVEAEPELRKKWEKERASSQQSQAKTDALIQNENARNGQPRPTNGGTGSSGSTNREILDTAPPNSPAYRAAYRAEHGFDPPR